MFGGGRLRYLNCITANCWSRPATLLLAAAIVVCASGGARAAFGKYWDSGPDSMRIVIAITGDGYTQAEQTQLGSDAAAVANAILTTSPWSTFANSINVYIISAISSQSGADKPWLGQYVNTLFDATYGTGGAQQCLTVDYSKVTTFLSGAIQKYDIVAVVVNDSMYGGSGHNAAVSSNHPAMTDIMLHELGHTFANLEEEYEGNPGPYLGPEPSNPNVTTVTNPALIKWRAWIDPMTPIPTAPPQMYPTQVGLFQGAFTYSLGIYRPMLDCKMRNIGSQFCSVCKEAHVMRAHNIAPLLDSITPPPSPLFDVFDITAFTALGNGWQYLTKTWKLDGTQIGTGDQITIHPGDVKQPFSLLDLSVVDNTPLIKSYPLPSQQHQWKLIPRVLPALSIADLRFMAPAYCRVSGVVSAVFPDCFYVQDANRVGTVRVYPYNGAFPTLGQTVDLCGRREPNSFNLTLSLCKWSAQPGASQPPRPLGMANQTLGGRTIGLQHGPGMFGLNNVGLLVRTWGRVLVTDPNGMWMTIDDGSPFRNDVAGHPGTRVYGTNLGQYANQYVSVTGICTADESNPSGPYPAAIRTRGAGDVVLVTEP